FEADQAALLAQRPRERDPVRLGEVNAPVEGPRLAIIMRQHVEAARQLRPERFWGDAPGLRALAGRFERLPGTRRGQFGDTHAAQVDLGVAHRAERARLQILADAP